MAGTPDQMFTHELNGVKGFYPGMPWVVDKAVDLDTTVTAADVQAGMVAHQDPTSKNLKLGVGTVTATRAPMPLILFQGGDDFDVLGDDGNFVGATSDGYLGRPMGLAVNMGAEVETTEYDSGTYTSGDLLTAGSDGKVEAFNGTDATTVLGVVSDGESTSEHDSSITLLRFHTVYLPALWNVQ